MNWPGCILFIPPSDGKPRPGRQTISYLQYVQRLIGNDCGQLSPDKSQTFPRITTARGVFQPPAMQSSNDDILVCSCVRENVSVLSPSQLAGATWWLNTEAKYSHSWRKCYTWTSPICSTLIFTEYKIIKDKAGVSSLLSLLEGNWINPFCIEQQVDLPSLSTELKLELPTCFVKDIGDVAYWKFIQQRLENPLSKAKFPWQDDQREDENIEWPRREN